MTRHSLLWLIIIIGAFLFSPLFVTTDEYEACIQKELTADQHWYGEEEFNTLVARANRMYDLTMGKSGIDGGIRTHFSKTTTTDEIAPGVKMPQYLANYSKHVDGYWQGMLDNVYLFCLRLAQAWTWIYYMTPFLFATLFDGVMRRKAKIASFKYTSPTLYNASWHLIIGFVAISLVAFSTVAPISAMAYPFVLGLIGLLIRLLISNVQHSA